jgi:hypothetical protein
MTLFPVGVTIPFNNLGLPPMNEMKAIPPLS